MKEERKIFGLIGEKGSGKDTFANYLIDKHSQKERKIIKLSFAEPLKAICQILYPQSTSEYFESRELKEKPSIIFGNKSPREVLQVVGTDLFRNHYDENIWINVMLSKIHSIDKDIDIIVTDIRFPNELHAIETLNDNVTIVKLERDVQKDERCSHISEKINRITLNHNVIVIDNNGTLENFYNEIDKKI